MGMSLTVQDFEKKISLKGELKAGNEIAVRVNQTLTQRFHGNDGVFTAKCGEYW